MSESVLPMFSSRSFVVSGLTFRSLIHFEFVLVCGVDPTISSLLRLSQLFFPSICMRMIKLLPHFSGKEGKNYKS